MKNLVLKKTQFQVVWEKLRTTGMITRDWCLKRNITRLSAYMKVIKNSGVKFSANYDITPTKRDYVYRLK